METQELQTIRERIIGSDQSIGNINSSYFQERIQNYKLLTDFLQEINIKKVNFFSYLTQESIEPELTMYVNPDIRVPSIEKRMRTLTFTQFWEHLMDLEGANSFETINLPNTKEDQDAIQINYLYKGKKIPFVIYYAKRNIVLLLFPLTINYFKFESNEYLKEILKILGSLKLEETLKEADVDEIIKQRTIKKYMEIFSRKIIQLKHDKFTVKSDIESYNSSLLGRYKRLTEINRQIQIEQQFVDNVEERIIKQIEEVKQLPFVTRCEFKGDDIEVELKKIFINVKGEDIEMGEYVLGINPDKITIKNKQPIIYYDSIYHSCHIDGNSICYGQGKEVVHKIHSEFKLKKLVHFLYLYLKSYNPEDTYLSMNYWIQAKKNGGKYPKDGND